MALQLNTYDALINAVKNVSEDDSQEFADYIPVAIGIAEMRLTKEIDTLGLKQNFDIPCVIGTRTISKPDGFRLTHDLFLFDSETGIESRLKRVVDDYLRDFWPNPSLTGTPRYFSPDYNNTQFLLAPTPDKAYTVKANVAADVTPLSTTNPENYFTEFCGETLFYATMVEMFRFMKNEEEKAQWEAAYGSSIAAVNNQGRRERRDDGVPPNNPSGGQNTLKGDN